MGVPVIKLKLALPVFCSATSSQHPAMTIMEIVSGDLQRALAMTWLSEAAVSRQVPRRSWDVEWLVLLVIRVVIVSGFRWTYVLYLLERIPATRVNWLMASWRSFSPTFKRHSASWVQRRREERAL